MVKVRRSDPRRRSEVVDPGVVRPGALGRTKQVLVRLRELGGAGVVPLEDGEGHAQHVGRREVEEGSQLLAEGLQIVAVVAQPGGTGHGAPAVLDVAAADGTEDTDQQDFVVVGQEVGHGRADVVVHVLIEQVEGDVQAHTSDGDIVIEGVSGILNAKTSDGNIVASIVSQPTENCYLKSSDGDIKLRINPGINAEINAQTSDGRIDSQLELAGLKMSKGRHLQGRLNSGGVKVMLKTSDGSVKLQPLD